MARSDRHIRTSALAAGTALTLAVAIAFWLGWLETLENGLYDLRAQRFQHFTPPPTDRIVHVDIDDPVLEAVGAWPWPRSVLAEQIDEMKLAGAKVIVLDVLFTQPQKVELVRGRDGAIEQVDHDANLAASFERAGNVLLPASLLFVQARPQTPAVQEALKLLTDDPSRSEGAIAEALRQRGFGPDLSDVESVFYQLRREAVQARVEDELRKGERVSWPATIPATSPTTRPSPANDADPAAINLMKRLFPKVDPSSASPEYRVVAESLTKARSALALNPFSRPSVSGVSAFKPRSELMPVLTLLKSADLSGFVDYPNITDGTVRSVPLFVDHRGKLFPQMGLRVACAMLDVKPEDLTITNDSVSVPAGKNPDGSSRAAINIPVRTVSRTFSSGRTVDYPLLMDIPWYGSRRWEYMYDTGRAGQKKQHISLAAVQSSVRTRHKLAATINGADRLVRDIIRLLGVFAGDLPEAYERRAIRNADASGGTATIEWFIKEVGELGYSPGDAMDVPGAGDGGREVIGALNTLANARDQLPALDAQLKRERAELRTMLDGKAAILGWTSTWQIADQKPTPLHPAAPGVVVHGVIASAILTGDVWRTPPQWVTILVALALGLLTTAAVAWLSPIKSLSTAVGLVVVYTVVNCVLLFDYGNLLMELGTPILAIAAPWAGGTITRLILEARERARIMRRFSSYVDPDIVNYFLETRDETQLAGKRQDTTVVFTDLEGFTTLSEKLGEDVVPVLNDFMGRAVSVIKRHRGIVNKFLGDGILFFFNAPRLNSTYVFDAMACILDLQRMMVDFNADLKKKDLPALKLRIGVTTGATITGDAGSQGRTDYTVIGDLVNLAARLESANKEFGTSNLVTDATVARVADQFLFRLIGTIQVKGKLEDVKVYETLSSVADATDAQKELANLTAAVAEAFETGDAKACLAAVERLETYAGTTKFTTAYRRVVEPYAAGVATGPMPKEIVLESK